MTERVPGGPGAARGGHYDGEELSAALRAVGVEAGRTVFSHSNIGWFGIPREGNSRETAHRVVLDAFRRALGPEGTLVVPTYTYSFCTGEPFDPVATPSRCGPWSEFVRRQPGARRSGDPIFSVAALGSQAERLTADLPQECFGAGSFWARLLQADGLVCNLNVWVISTLIHHVEWRLGVPYRFEKLFPGLFVSGGTRRKGAAIFFCRDLNNPDTLVATEPFDRLALERGLARRASVGRGHVTGMAARDVFRLIRETLPDRPHFLIRAEERGRAPVLERCHQRFETPLPPEASMGEMIEALWGLPRDIVSDGYDAALRALAAQLPMTIHAYPTGMRAWSWIVPGEY